jgi:hypothetical protein
VKVEPCVWCGGTGLVSDGKGGEETCPDCWGDGDLEVLPDGTHRRIVPVAKPPPNEHR